MVAGLVRNAVAALFLPLAVRAAAMQALRAWDGLAV